MRKTRAAFISAGGDPYLLLLMLRLFKRWRDEVDKLYICYNAVISPEISNYLESEAKKDPKIEWIFVPRALGFGDPIKECLKVCKEDLIVLLEDDGFVYQPRLLDSMFKRIESGECDALGSPRFSCSPGIAEATKKKYNLDYSGTDDVGPNFWPNFLFLKREDLLKTDLFFGGKGWKKGEYIKELDMTCENDEAGDTFVWTCMQLRAMGLRFISIPQNHASPTEIEDIPLKRYNHKNGFIGWIHGGSLSSGWNSFLVTPQVEPEGLGKQEFETRVAFWTLISDVEKIPDNEFYIKYKMGIRRLTEECKLDLIRINQKYSFYKILLQI
jgi:hypothetical protein